MASAGILLVDKPGGITSHDVVAAARRALGTRKIGHAGTLDPMATGLLVLGVEAATRLLTFIVGLDKSYEATIRLGESTTSDDADSEVIARKDASGIGSAAIAAAIPAFTGRISQVPSTVSAIKVAGRRAYERVRAGETVELAPREVEVSRFELLAERRAGETVDLHVVVDCSSGTYIRALARDLGATLGVGGHLTALRRTRIGPFAVRDAAGLDTLELAALRTPAEAATSVLDTIAVTADEARDLRHGKRLAKQASRLTGRHGAAIDPAGVLVGILERRGDDLGSVMNMPVEAR